MFFFVFTTVLCSFLYSAFSFPLAPQVKRDVWSPPIIYPTNTTVWTAGDTYNITWSIANEPSEVTNPIGMVFLRHGVNGTEETVLTQGFPLISGAVNVTIPANTEPDVDYIIILMGDSGNWSPLFTIVSQPS